MIQSRIGVIVFSGKDVIDKTAWQSRGKADVIEIILQLKQTILRIIHITQYL